MIRSLLILLLRIYQWTISPFLAFLGGPGTGCRFQPSCSQYAVEALQRHGAWRGADLALRRLCRCHPWGGCGFDPVPTSLSSIRAKHAPSSLFGSAVASQKPLQQTPPGPSKSPTR